MSEDADWWPPEGEDFDVDPMWLPPFNGKTRFEYLSGTTEMVYKDAAHYLSDREFGKGDKYPDGRKYTANQMLHGIVYRFLFSEDNVKGHVDPITSWNKLESHLKSSPRVASLLGFNGDVPSWDSFRRYWNDIDDEDQEFIQEMIVRTYKRQISNVLLKSNHPQRTVFGDWTPEPDEITTDEKKEAIRHIRGTINEILDFGRDHTKQYDRELLLDLQSTVSGTGESIDAVLNHLRDESDQDIPYTSGFFWNIKKRSADEWNELFEEVYDIQTSSAQAAGFLDPENEKWTPDEYVADGKFDAYIDATVLPYYQNKKGEKPDGVTGGSKTSGTHYGFTFCTISTHADRRSFHLASMPYEDETEYEDAVEYLLDRALESIDVDVVCIDSEYSGVEVLTMLEDCGQDFIIQYPKYEGIKKKVALLDQKFDQTPHVVDPDSKPLKTGELTLLAEPNYNKNPPSDWDWGFDVSDSDLVQNRLSDYGGDESGDRREHLNGKSVNEVAELLELDDIPKEHHQYRRAYLTNLDVPEGEEAETISRYNKRWRIETKYRMVKHEFTPKTRTSFHQVRNFFWNFSCVLYNSWVLLDVYLEADNPHITHDDRHQFTANRFMKYFSEPEESD